MVIMNTTLHWRSNTTLLLSWQSFELLRSHMAPGAVLAFNATGSPDAFYTATRVFPHAYRYMNFVYAADFDFRARKDAPQARAVYEAMRLGGQPYFPAGSPAIEQMLRQPFITLEAEAWSRRPELVTDENMITEFRFGRPVYHWLDFISF